MEPVDRAIPFRRVIQVTENRRLRLDLDNFFNKINMLSSKIHRPHGAEWIGTAFALM